MIKTALLAAVIGLAALAGAGPAQAQCVTCCETTCRPAPHHVRLVPHHALRPVVTTRLVPVVTYRAVRRVHYVQQTYYTRRTCHRRVHAHHSGYATLGDYSYGDHRHLRLDASYGLVLGR
ncbi:hypothetical protein SAMN06265338_103149 [Rhodoblastus acidophilus]|uniref:Uncharacterized protein n=2 Tax=Rhodoblastus acidophilus TaxID=1074 RepID=A0A212RA34_RHOAC|nr:hypothetical protein CKO16_06015 [Rhodoblastus acidophilus]RAI22381.1 hypothetical protein CH337_05210 [Rhodoblastus acidophilus]SNB69024.1 hypothetical protein SAMN06265338_103149 [Rhodoblastus acidophilus]